MSLPHQVYNATALQCELGASNAKSPQTGARNAVHNDNEDSFKTRESEQGM